MNARILLVAVLLASTPALAQPADKQDAQSLMQSGVKLLEAKDYLGALAVFKTAYERFPSAKILLNIGTTLKLLGRDAEAANAYARYLADKEADPKRRPGLEKLIAEIDKTVGRVTIHTTPADAQLQIDGDDWTTPGTWRVTPGKHEIHTRRDGYEPKTAPVEVAAGEEASLDITLALVPKPKPTIVTVPVETTTAVVAKAAPEAPRSRFGVLALGHFDIPHGGAALVGVTADLTDRIEARGAAIVGPTFGGYVGGTYALLAGTYRPYVAAGVPLFVSHGLRYAVRGACGLEASMSRHLAVLVELGVEHNFNPEMGKNATLFVPAVGLAGRL